MSFSINSVSGNTPSPHGDRAEMEARMDKTMQGVADLLGMSTDELKAARKEGTTLADLASQKGISQDELVDKLAEGLAQNAPEDLPKDIDFTQLATNIVNGTRPERPFGPPPGLQERFGTTSESSASDDLAALLEQNGVDTEGLLEILSGNSSSVSSDFISQLNSLLSKYDNKGLLYDTSA